MLIQAENREVLDILVGKSPESKKATEILEVANKSKTGKILYEAREVQIYDVATAIQEGREKARVKMIKNSLRMGWELIFISEFMDENIEKIKSIKQELIERGEVLPNNSISKKNLQKESLKSQIKELVNNFINKHNFNYDDIIDVLDDIKLDLE